MPTATPTDVPASVLISSVESLVAQGEAFPAEDIAYENTQYYGDFEMAYDQTLHGIFSTVNMYPALEPYWQVGYAVLDVTYECSPLVLDYPSSITFSMNGTPFHSISLTGSEGGRQHARIPVPARLLTSGTNTLEFLGYARLWDEEGCVDDFSNANWINILAQTRLRVGYDLHDDVRRISYFPFPFLSSEDKTGEQLLIAVSDEADEAEITAAMLLMAGIGNKVTDENRITVGPVRRADAFKSTIYFGLEKNTPKQYLALLPDEDLSNRAVIVRAYEQGKELMLVVSADAEALVDAARMLSDDSRVDQEKVAVTYVQKGTSQTIMQNREKMAMSVVGEYPIEDLAGGGLSFVGPFHQEKIVYLPLGGYYVLGDKSKIHLKFRYSENLDFTRSLLTVYWGEIPIGSKKLTKEGAAGDELIIYAPADAVGTAAASVKFSFDLEIQDMYCTPRQEEMPWAYIAADSVLYLPVSEGGMLALNNRPAPFVKGKQLSDMMLVVSDRPGEAELTLLGRTMCVYGANTEPYGQLRAIRAGNFSERDADYNIVAVGTNGNGFFAQVVEDMFFSFDGDGKLVSNGSLYLSDSNAGAAGTIQLIRSPFAEDRAMLLLAGPSEETIRTLSKLIGNDALRWNLKNDCVVVDQEMIIRAYQMAARTSEEQPPTFVESVLGNRDALLFTLTATSAMLVLLLGVALVLIRIRMRNRPEK